MLSVLVEKSNRIRASKGYIENNLKINIPSPDTDHFSKITFDIRAYFVLKLLVLHKTDSIVKFAPKGKLSGITEGEFIVNPHYKKRSYRIFLKTLYG